MKETTEIVDVTFDIAAQAIVSGKDGFDLTDIPSFFDEATRIPGAIAGLVDAFAVEVGGATEADIEILFEEQREKLTRAGLHAKASGMIVSGLKTVFYGLSLGFEKGAEELIDRAPQPEKRPELAPADPGVGKGKK